MRKNSLHHTKRKGSEWSCSLAGSELANVRSPRKGGVEEVTGRVDELGYFLGTQDLRELAIAFGSRNIFEAKL
jgi:hypothetical protein